MAKFISKSEQNTKAFAQKMARKTKKGTIYCLKGELGSGKTTFVRGFAAALGIKGKISSPTFNLVKTYALASGPTLYHFDLYRLKNAEELMEIGFKEILDDNSALVLIEWPEIAKDFLPEDVTTIAFQYGARPEERLITVTK